MYKFSIDQVRNAAFLTKLVKKFKDQEIPRFNRDQNYYEVKTAILKRTMENGKPNNRLAHGFARYITNMATSYFAGKPIKYVVEDDAYKDALYDVFRHNYLQTLNFEVSKEASKKGISYLLLFINEDGELRYKKCNAEELIPIYSTSLDEFLEGAIRIWSEHDIDGRLLYEYAELYDKQNITTYMRANTAADFEEMETRPHRMTDIPVIVIWNNEECCGDYEPHISLIDAYDKSQSDTSNDMEYFTDAYLCIAGASDILESALTDGDSEENNHNKAAADLRKNRILFLDEKGQAEWLVKSINDTAVENYKDRIYKDLFFLSQVPALSDESFSSNLSGVAIRYKLIGLEELGIMKENRFRAAQNKLIKLTTDFLNLKMNKSWDADTVEQKYERNFINNTSEIIENIGKLENIVSKETQLDLLPNEIVQDSGEEMDKIKQEAAALSGIPYVDMTTL